jgi:serine/threonine protein phosphatase PrpC
MTQRRRNELTQSPNLIFCLAILCHQHHILQSVFIVGTHTMPLVLSTICFYHYVMDAGFPPSLATLHFGGLPLGGSISREAKWKRGVSAPIDQPRPLSLSVSANNTFGLHHVVDRRSGGSMLEVPQSATTRVQAILDVGVSENANPAWRATMEDMFVVKPGVGYERPDPRTPPIGGYFAVYDGHGGRGAVDFVYEQLERAFLEELPGKTPSEAFNCAFARVDALMINRRDFQQSGTTVLTAFIREEHHSPGSKSLPPRTLFVANCGDTRAVLSVNGKAQRLSVDHTPKSAKEARRVRKAGGLVFNSRVNGQLAVSRALGDCALKQHGVSAIPAQCSVVLGDEHRFLILACDGLWDVVSDQEGLRRAV